MGQIKQIHIAYDYFDDSSPVGAQSSFMQEISQGNSVGRRRDPPLLWLWLPSIEGVWGIHFFYDLLAADLLTGSGENREVFFFFYIIWRERKVQPISCMRPAGKGKKTGALCSAPVWHIIDPWPAAECSCHACGIIPTQDWRLVFFIFLCMKSNYSSFLYTPYHKLYTAIYSFFVQLLKRKKGLYQNFTCTEPN